MIGDNGKKAMKMIGLSELTRRDYCSIVSYSGFIDDMAAMLSISSLWDGGRLDFLE